VVAAAAEAAAPAVAAEVGVVAAAAGAVAVVAGLGDGAAGAKFCELGRSGKRSSSDRSRMPHSVVGPFEAAGTGHGLRARPTVFGERRSV
jgi:hypothetical protein